MHMKTGTSGHASDHEESDARQLMDRRGFFKRGVALASGAASVGLVHAAHAQSLVAQPWERVYGSPNTAYGQPSRFEQPIGRHVAKPYGDLAPGTGPALTPIEALDGIVTPNSLHFIRSQRHAGHRSAAASALDSWTGRAAADVLDGNAVALSNDH
jgi:sulfane dehydrogenase subunit SoxC